MIGNARAIRDDKRACYEWGEIMEQHFVENVIPRLRVNGLPLEGGINPEKAGDKYADDLLFTGGVDQRVELKATTTPMFLAKQMYRLDPQWTFTLNVSDVNQMEDKLDIFNDDPLVFLYLLFEQATLDEGKKEFGINGIQPVEGVWAITLDALFDLVDNHSVPVHTYKSKHRKKGNRQGNATKSYVLNLNDSCFHRMTLVRPAGLKPATTR